MKRTLFFLLLSCSAIVQVTSKPTTTWPDVFTKAKGKVVQIFSSGNDFDWFLPFRQGDESAGAGSGFIATKQGDIYTNYHVVDGSDIFKIQHPDLWKEQFLAEFIGGSPEYDWAHLRLLPDELERLIKMLPAGTLEYFDLGDSDGVVEGQEVMLIGYPKGEEDPKQVIGNISGLQSNDTFGEVFTTTAPSNPGNSGGPAIDMTGRVIGVVVGHRVDAVGINHLIPINRLKVIMDELEDGKVIEHAFWGLHLVHTTPKTFEYLGSPVDAGVYVARVEKGSLAEQAGIMKGDIISTINGLKVDRFAYVMLPWTKSKLLCFDVLARIKNGTPAIFEVYRNGQLLNCSVTKTSGSSLKIKTHHLPFEQDPEFDVFGGMVFMELALNHLQVLMGAIYNRVREGYFVSMDVIRLVSKFLDHDNQHESRLIITHLLPESELAKNDVSITNCLVKNVNGIQVHTLQDFQKAVRDGVGTGYMVLETEGGTKVALLLKEIVAQEPKLAKKYRYNLSPLVKDLGF